jgi:hypothetical protein
LGWTAQTAFDQHVLGTFAVTDLHNPAQLRRRMIRIFLLKVLMPLSVLGAVIVAITILQLNGTLREFLDQQSMFGMIAVVVVINIVGFSFVCLLMMVWQCVRNDLLRSHDR